MFHFFEGLCDVLFGCFYWAFVYDHVFGHSYRVAESDGEFACVSFVEGLPVFGVVGSSSFVEAVEACLRRGIGSNEYEFGVVFLEFGYFV